MKTFYTHESIDSYNCGKYIESSKTYLYYRIHHHGVTVARAKKIAKRYGANLNMNKCNPKSKGKYLVVYSKRTKKLTITFTKIRTNWSKDKRVF